MNFTSSSGTFSTVAGLPINGQEHFVLDYNATDLTLDVVSGPGTGLSAVGGSSSTGEPYIAQLGNGVSSQSFSGSLRSSSTPEPGSILLFGTGIALGAGGLRRKLRG
jgi:hypothetical protein